LASTDNFNSGSATASLSIAESTPANPTQIVDNSSLQYFLDESTAMYAAIGSDIQVTGGLLEAPYDTEKLLYVTDDEVTLT
jgi:hypothetical protein